MLVVIHAVDSRMNRDVYHASMRNVLRKMIKQQLALMLNHTVQYAILKDLGKGLAFSLTAGTFSIWIAL